MAMVKHDGPTLARVSRTDAGRKRGVFTKAWSEGFSSRTVVETWGGGKGLSLHDTRERKRLSFENVKRRGWIKGGGKATRTPSLSHGAIWIPWKSVTAAFRGSLATRRAADSSADGCYSYGLDGNIWIPEGSVYGASFFEEWLNEVAIRPGCRRSGAARFNVSGLRRVEWWMDI